MGSRGAAASPSKSEGNGNGAPAVDKTPALTGAAE
jgi:hypothetical protein